MKEPYVKKTYFGMAIDPVHLGTGGYTLGRVDNPIIRDFDGVPKIPGTSIEGAARTYAFYQGIGKNKACAKGKKIKSFENNETSQPCGKDDCELCLSFGYTTDEKSRQGMAIFSDARILFFPVASIVGPVWITSPDRLNDLGVRSPQSGGFNWEGFDKSGSCIVSEHIRKEVKFRRLNFGWILLQLEENGGQPVKHDISENTQFGEKNSFKERGLDKREIFDRLVIVSDSVFSQIVNSNLEIRTSVSIDPETGAAEEHALFTYEAIPRGTIFQFTMVYQSPQHFGVSKNIDKVISTVETGLKLLEFLGIGGMGTRGFGKLKIFGLDEKPVPSDRGEGGKTNAA